MKAWEEAVQVWQLARAHNDALSCRRLYHDSDQSAVVDRTYTNLLQTCEVFVARHRELNGGASSSLATTREPGAAPRRLNSFEVKQLLCEALGVEWRTYDVTRVVLELHSGADPVQVTVTRAVVDGTGLNPPQLQRVQQDLQLVARTPAEQPTPCSAGVPPELSAMGFDQQ